MTPPEIERVSHGRTSAALSSALLRGERRVLLAIAQYEHGVSREQLTVLRVALRCSLRPHQYFPPSALRDGRYRITLFQEVPVMSVLSAFAQSVLRDYNPVVSIPMCRRDADGRLIPAFQIAPTLFRGTRGLAVHLCSPASYYLRSASGRSARTCTSTTIRSRSTAGTSALTRSIRPCPPRSRSARLSSVSGR